MYRLKKASVLKRISAWMLDAILLCVAVVGFAFLLSSILNFDEHNRALDAAYTKYEQEYGITFEITEELYNNMTEAELKAYNDAYAALIQDEEAMYEYNMVVNLTLVILSLGILLAYLALEFFLPNFLGNGQTIGKKIFGIAVIREDGVRVTAPLMFIRTVLGKYAIETMVPVLIVIMIYFNMAGLPGLLILGLILLVQVILMIATHTNSAIHDVLAKTVAVDLATQMIFASEQEMIEYKNKVQAEKASRQAY